MTTKTVRLTKSNANLQDLLLRLTVDVCGGREATTKVAASETSDKQGLGKTASNHANRLYLIFVDLVKLKRY